MAHEFIVGDFYQSPTWFNIYRLEEVGDSVIWLRQYDVLPATLRDGGCWDWSKAGFLNLSGDCKWLVFKGCPYCNSHPLWSDHDDYICRRCRYG